MTETVLWDYRTDGNGNIAYGTKTLTLRHSIDDYDNFVIELVSASSDLTDPNWDSTMFYVLPVQPIINGRVPGMCSLHTYNTRGSQFQISGNQFTSTPGTNDTNGVVKIIGVKY